MASFPAQTGKAGTGKAKPVWLSMRQQTMGVLGCSGISWTICKQSAPRSRQITMPVPHHLFFTGRMLFLMPNQQCQSTEGNVRQTVHISGSFQICWLALRTSLFYTITLNGCKHKLIGSEWPTNCTSFQLISCIHSRASAAVDARRLNVRHGNTRLHTDKHTCTHCFTVRELAQLSWLPLPGCVFWKKIFDYRYIFTGQMRFFSHKQQCHSMTAKCPRQTIKISLTMPLLLWTFLQDI